MTEVVTQTRGVTVLVGPWPRTSHFLNNNMSHARRQPQRAAALKRIYDDDDDLSEAQSEASEASDGEYSESSG